MKEDAGQPMNFGLPGSTEFLGSAAGLEKAAAAFLVSAVVIHLFTFRSYSIQ